MHKVLDSNGNVHASLDMYLQGRYMQRPVWFKLQLFPPISSQNSEGGPCAAVHQNDLSTQSHHVASVFEALPTTAALAGKLVVLVGIAAQDATSSHPPVG